MECLPALVFLVALSYVKAEETFLPDYIHPCNYTKDDVEGLDKCIKEQIEESLPHFAKGIPELSVPSIDPVDIDDIIIDGKGLKLKFTEAKMHGLSTVNLSNLKVRFGGDNETFDLSVKGNLSLTAKYVADGKILILPIKGEGDALIDCQNVEVHITCNLTHIKGKDKAEHLKLVSPNYKYDIGKTIFHLKNLFNGNKQLSDATHKFANENWHQLMDDLAPPAIKQIVKTIVKNINKFFSKVRVSRIIKGYDEKL